MERLKNLSADWGLLSLRLALGIIFLYHGYLKLSNLSQTAQFFQNNVGFPGFIGYLVGFVEFFGGLFLILGILEKWASIGVGIIMLGALYFKIFVWKVPFFAMDKTGWEFDLILLASAISIFILGGGNYSIRRFFKK